jgi:general secretion pathway protein A
VNEPVIPASEVGETHVPDHMRKGAEAESLAGNFLNYFGLNEQPFGVTPDPRFLYVGPKHRQALAALNYGTELNRGFLTLIAKPGMGKTSLLFQYLGDLQGKARTAFLFQTTGDARDLMRYLLADLGLNGTGKDFPEMHSMLYQLLVDEGRANRRLVLVIDEAQNLDEKALEFVRLLSNFETPSMKLMQIVLAGQPQLAEKLALPSMAQLRQRVSFSIKIEPLNCEEVDAYVDHRLAVAGYKGSSLFSAGARMLLAEHSQGIPRNINNICFCAMSLACATNAKMIDRETMRDVLADLAPGPPGEKPGDSPKPADQPRQIVPEKIYAPILTLKDEPARRWQTKVAIACIMLFALCWSAAHFNLGQRLEVHFHTMAAPEKSYVDPTPVPGFLPQGTPTVSHDSSMGTISKAPSDTRNQEVPMHGTAETELPMRGTN